MIWLKRLLPLIVLAATWYGYDYFQKHQHESEVSEARQIARVTSQLWLANTDMRPDSARFLAFRDSLLLAERLTKDQIDVFLARFKEDPVKYDTFTVFLNYYVDSLTHRKPDTLTIDSLPSDSGAGE